MCNARSVKKTSPLERKLERLSQIRNAHPDIDVSADLQYLLGNKSSLVVAKAAAVVAERESTACIPQLIESFHRLLAAGNDGDPRCGAKIEVAKALWLMAADAETVFLKGIRHFQYDGIAWGGAVADTATELRGLCGLGLVRMKYRDVMLELVNLLVDKEAPAQVAAARALGESEREDAIPLLRLRVLAGRAEAEVVEECFRALLALSLDKSFSFVAGHLESKDVGVSEAAALAIGGAKHRDSFAVLRDSLANRNAYDPVRGTLFLAIATLRDDDAIGFLIDALHSEDAEAAIGALALYKGDEKIATRVRSAVPKSGPLAAVFRREFGE